MRLSSSAIVAALPALVAAQDPLEQIKTQIRSVLDQAVLYLPNPSTYDPVAAAEAKVGALKLSTLTLENWKDTLYEPVTPGATTPEEWWVLVSGGNKTCYGTIDIRCHLDRRHVAWPSV
jgi:hypothetical protein